MIVLILVFLISVQFAYQLMKRTMTFLLKDVLPLVGARISLEQLESTKWFSKR